MYRYKGKTNILIGLDTQVSLLGRTVAPDVIRVYAPQHNSPRRAGPAVIRFNFNFISLILFKKQRKARKADQ